jgi:hypothetical protein
MTFEEALKEMRNGKKVKRPIWTKAYLFLGKEVDSDDLKNYIYCGTFDSKRVYRIQAIKCSNIMSSDWETI